MLIENNQKNIDRFNHDVRQAEDEKYQKQVASLTKKIEMQKLEEDRKKGLAGTSSDYYSNYYQPSNHSGSCPSCGYCKHCGRSNRSSYQYQGPWWGINSPNYVGDSYPFSGYTTNGNTYTTAQNVNQV